MRKSRCCLIAAASLAVGGFAFVAAPGGALAQDRPAQQPAARQDTAAQSLDKLTADWTDVSKKALKEMREKYGDPDGIRTYSNNVGKAGGLILGRHSIRHTGRANRSRPRTVVHPRCLASTSSSCAARIGRDGSSIVRERERCNLSWPTRRQNGGGITVTIVTIVTAHCPWGNGLANNPCVRISVGRCRRV
jgi:hypothetical protein